MPANSPLKSRKTFPFLTILIGIAVLGVIAAAGGFIYAANQEQHDSFCISCHTQPESTFYQRAHEIRPVDLASYHFDTQVNCIDCHSGSGLTGRLSAELLGARNAFRWYTGIAAQPAILRHPITDQTCLKCHPDVTQLGFSPRKQFRIPGVATTVERDGDGHSGHWHQLLVKWQAADPYAGHCTSCHNGHGADAAWQAGFMNSQNVQAVCDACHKVLRRAEGG